MELGRKIQVPVAHIIETPSRGSCKTSVRLTTGSLSIKKSTVGSTIGGRGCAEPVHVEEVLQELQSIIFSVDTKVNKVYKAVVILERDYASYPEQPPSEIPAERDSARGKAYP
jgi:hypothetical protein